ncbi:MAG TPA: energy transducer TonB [Terriglobales bacterium]|nr:energy transducer TonB [Terriglobales bacterium]
MDYPPLARLARVEGKVSITARLKQEEHSSEYRVDTYEATGQPMLKEAALKNLRGWWFYCDDCKSPEDKTFQVTYEFRFDEECMESQCFMRSSTFQSDRVLVKASALEVVTTDSKQ